MTEHGLPADPSGSAGDSEKKKWGYKRQQFDAVVSRTRFNGAIDNLVNRTLEVRALLVILDELNSSNQRGRYMAEVLAFKQESRRLASVPFDARVAEFLMEGSRRIPFLSDGLASQMAVALASAADNLAYLDTVNAAVSNLLLDLDRPLKPDTRNYLRALTDKIDATRRLQEARGHLATVPSVYPSVLPESLANAKSPDPPTLQPAPLLDADPAQDEATKQLEKNQVLAVGESNAGFDEDWEELEPTALKPGPKYTSQRTLMMPAPAGLPAQRGTDPLPAEVQAPRDDRAVLEGAVTVLVDAVDPSGSINVPPRPVLARQAASNSSTPRKSKITERPSITSHGPIPVPSRRPARFLSLRPSKSDPHAGGSDTQVTTPAGKTTPGLGVIAQQALEQGVATNSPAAGDVSRAAASAVAGATAARQPDLDDGDVDSVRIPTRKLPVWVIVTAAGGLIAAAGTVWALNRSTATRTTDNPAASLALAPAPSIAPATKKPRSKGAAKASASVAPPAEPPAVASPPAPPPPAPPAPPPPVTAHPAPPPVTAHPALPKVTQAPVVRTPAPTPKPVHVVAPTPTAKPIQPVPEPVAPKPKATATAPTPEPVAAPTTPKPSRTIDDILVELLQVPNDSASIEAKAHEVARIVSRAAKADAEHIISRMIPEEILAGTENADTRALEPVRRVVALLLKKVALDKDDQRAALAIGSLGEWAKLRKHGAAAKVTLDELAESPVILARPKRLHALEQVQARLGISNAGE